MLMTAREWILIIDNLAICPPIRFLRRTPLNQELAIVPSSKPQLEY